MLRAVLLGKIVLAIVVCFVGAVICFNIAGGDALPVAQSVKWYLLSGFFLIVGLSFCFVTYLLFRPRIKSKSKSRS